MLVHSTTSCQYSVDFIYNKHSVVASINELLAQVCPIIFYQLELLLINLKSIDQAMQGKHYRKIKWTLQLIYVVYCTIWYHLYNLKNVENTHGGVLILDGCFSCFLNCTNGTKSRNASQMSFFFLFSMYYSYLLTAKSTLDFNDSF